MDLFEDEIRHEKDRDGRKIVLIGKIEGKICKDCRFCYREVYSKVYYRCKNYPKKNWKVKTVACKFYEEE